MHAILAFVALVTVACGRLAFDDRQRDASSDVALAEHDEDRDGIDDALDPCPHIGDDGGDADGDRVGDACDPLPSTPTESIAVFATFRPGDQPLVGASGLTQEADSLRYNQVDGVGLYLQRAIATARIELGFEIYGIVGAGQHQIASGVERANPFYFVELNENGGIRNVSVVQYVDGAGYTHLAGVDHAGMHAGVGFLRYDVNVGGTRRYVGRAGWIGELYDIAADTPSYDGGAEVRITLNGLDVSLTYLVVIETQ